MGLDDEQTKVEYRKQALEKFKLVAVQHMPTELLEGQPIDVAVSLYEQFAVDSIATRFVKAIWGREAQERVVRYPKDWWQGVKERWFPQWMKDRWPIEYTVEKLTARELYPQLKFDPRVGERVINILGGDPPQDYDQWVLDSHAIRDMLSCKFSYGGIGQEDFKSLVDRLLDRMGPQEVAIFRKEIERGFHN